MPSVCSDATSRVSKAFVLLRVCLRQGRAFKDKIPMPMGSGTSGRAVHGRIHRQTMLTEAEDVRRGVLL